MDFFGKMQGQPSQEQFKKVLSGMSDQQLQSILQSNPQLLRNLQQMNKNTHKSFTSSQFFKIKQIQTHLDSQGGIHIIPDKGLVLKLFQQKTNQKIFVNLVGHPAIDAPDQRALVDYDQGVGIRVPLSMGKLREDSDKKGQPCKTIDICMNHQVIKALDKDPGLMSLVVQLITAHIQQKIKIYVQDRFVRLKQMKYKGGAVQHHRVKGKKQPKIQLITRQQKKAQQHILQQIKQQQIHQIKSPQFKLYLTKNGMQHQYDGDLIQCDQLVIKFMLPLLIHSRGIILQIGYKQIFLKVGIFYQIILKCPISMNPDIATAIFDSTKRQLELRVMCLKQVIIDKNNINNNNQNNIKQQSKRQGLQSQLLYDIM